MSARERMSATFVHYHVNDETYGSSHNANVRAHQLPHLDSYRIPCMYSVRVLAFTGVESYRVVVLERGDETTRVYAFRRTSTRLLCVLAHSDDTVLGELTHRGRARRAIARAHALLSF